MKNPRSFFVTYNLRLLTLFLAGFLILSSNQTAHAGDENALSVTVSEGQLVPVTDVPEVRKKRELLKLLSEGRSLSLQEYRYLAVSSRSTRNALLQFVQANPSETGVNRDILNLIIEHRLSRGSIPILAETIAALEDDNLISEILMHLSYHRSDHSIRLLARLASQFPESRKHLNDLAFELLLKKGPKALKHWRLIAQTDISQYEDDRDALDYAKLSGFSQDQIQRAQAAAETFAWADNYNIRNQEVSAWLYSLFLFDQNNITPANGPGIQAQAQSLSTELPKTYEIRGLLEQQTPAAKKGLVEWIRDPRANDLQKMTLFQLIAQKAFSETTLVGEGGSSESVLKFDAKTIELFGEIIGDGMRAEDLIKYQSFFVPRDMIPNDLGRAKLYLLANALIKSPNLEIYEDGSDEQENARQKQDFLIDQISKHLKQDVEVLNYIVGSKNLPSYAKAQINGLILQQSLSFVKIKAPWQKSDWFSKEETIEFAHNTAIGVGLGVQAVRSGIRSTKIKRGKPYDFFRFQIQTYLFKKLLSVAEKPLADRILALEDAVKEIDKFLDTPTKIISVNTKEELEAQFATLESEYKYLNDEMEFDKLLSERTPVQLDVAPELVPDLLAFSEKLRDLDYYIDEFGFKGYVTDVLSEDSPLGRFARQKVAEEDFLKKMIAEEISKVFNKDVYDELMLKARDLLASKSDIIKDPALRRMLILFIENYYLSWEFDEAKNILKRIMERPDKRRIVDVLGLVISYSGPLFLKVLQIVSGLPIKSDEIKEILEPLLENNVRSAFENVRDDLQPPIGFDFIEGWEQDPNQRYGPVGTMAETRFLKVVPEGTPFEDQINSLVQEIATRVRRHKIQDQLESEIDRILTTIEILDNDPIMAKNGFPKLLPIVKDVIEITKEELFIEKTIANQERGRVTYTSSHEGTIKITKSHVAKVQASGSSEDVNYDDPMMNNEEVIISQLTGDVGTKHEMKVNFLVAENIPSRDETKTQHMTKQPGISYQKFIKDGRNHLVSQFIAEKLAVKWLGETLFNSRFFHADLHAGNIKISKVDENEYDVSLLDFGLAGDITKDQTEKLIELVLASTNSSDRTTIAKIFHELAEDTPKGHSVEDLAEALERHYEFAIELHKNSYLKKHNSLDGYQPKTITLADILLMAMIEGYKLPQDFTAAVRGLSAIQTLLKASNSQKTIKDFLGPLIMENPGSAAGVYLRIKGRNIMKSITGLDLNLGSIFGGSSDEEAKEEPQAEDWEEKPEVDLDSDALEVARNTVDTPTEETMEQTAIDTETLGLETPEGTIAEPSPEAEESTSSGWSLRRMIGKWSGKTDKPAADKTKEPGESWSDSLRRRRSQVVEAGGSIVNTGSDLAARARNLLGKAPTCETQFAP